MFGKQDQEMIGRESLYLDAFNQERGKEDFVRDLKNILKKWGPRKFPT